MAYTTFCRILKEQGVNFVVVDGEADMAVASMALKNGCCAVSKDSNFFIFDLPFGYIPCDALIVSSKSLTVSARMYTSERFASTLNVPKDMLPAFASLIGNEHVSGAVLRLFHQQVSTDFPPPPTGDAGEEEGVKTPSNRHTLIRSIAQLCEKHTTTKELLQAAVEMVRGKELPAVEDAEPIVVDAVEFEKSLNTSVASYDLKGRQVNIGETTSLKPLPGVPSIGDAFPPWLVTAYRRGDLSSRLMDVLVSKTFWCTCTMENVDEESAWAVSSTLRRVCYGVLLGPQGADKIEVKEYIRKEAKFEENPVTPIFDIDGAALPAIGKMNETSEDVRRQTALKALNADKALSKLPNALILPAAALRSWVLAAAAADSQVAAWEVSVFVACAVATEHTPSAKKSAREDRPAWLTSRSLHRLAQYQTMLECAELVNEVLCKPLQSPLIGEVFDGVVAGRLYHQASKGASVSVLLNKVGGNLEQFTAMYDAVVEGIENQLQGEVVYEGVTDARAGSREKPVAPGMLKVDVKSKNLFAGLDGDGSEEEEDEEESESKPAAQTAPVPEAAFAPAAPKKEKKKTKEEEDIDALMAEMEAMETKKAAENEAKAAAKAAKKKAAKEKGKKK